MDHLGNAGSVAYLKEIKHPISVARKIMEKQTFLIIIIISLHYSNMQSLIVK